MPLDRNKALFALLLTISAVAYLPGLAGGFLFDDYPNIVRNQSVQIDRIDLDTLLALTKAEHPGGMFRPLSMLSIGLNHYAAGLNPYWFKLTNLFLHLINGTLLFLILTTLAGITEPQQSTPPKASALLPALAAGLWLLAPIHVSTVLYVVQRMELLGSLFLLLGVALYLCGRARQISGQRGWHLVIPGPAICVLGGILSKESAAIMPLFLLLAEFFALRFRVANEQRSRLLLATLLLLTAVPGVIAAMIFLPDRISATAYAARDFSLYERLLTQARVLFSYIQWIVLPHPGVLSFYHDDYLISRSPLNPVTTAVALAGHTFLMVGIIVGRRRFPLICLGAAWFYVAHTLTATVIPLEMVYEHRNYLASAGVILCLCSVVFHLTSISSRAMLTTLATLALCWSAGVTVMRAAEWSDPVRLAVSEASRKPLSPRAHYDKGWALTHIARQQNQPGHLVQARSAFETARNLPRSSILPDTALIMLAGQEGWAVKPEWWGDLVEKLRSKPLKPEDYEALSALLLCQINEVCPRWPSEMLHVYLTVLEQKDVSDRILADYARFSAFLLGDLKLAQQIAQQLLGKKQLDPRLALAMQQILTLSPESGE